MAGDAGRLMWNAVRAAKALATPILG